MIKQYIKKQPSVKAIQFHGLRDIADVAELVEVDLSTAKVVIQNQPDGYSIQFNESAPVYMRVGAWIVKTENEFEVLSDAQFKAKYEETRVQPPYMIGDLTKRTIENVRPQPAPNVWLKGAD